MEFFKKKPDIILLAVLALCVFIFVQLINGMLSGIRGGDGISYVMLAKSIATGHGFADINVPGAPAHTQYPPLLPLLLAPFFYLFGFNFTWMQLVVAGFGVATVWMVKSYFEEEAGQGMALALAFLVGTNFYFLFFVKEIMTEVPYAFLSLLALHWFGRYERRGLSARLLVVVSALTAAAYMMRMIGITLWAAMAAALLYGAVSGRGEKAAWGKKLILFGALAILPFAAWSIRGSIYSHGVATYQSIFMQADYYARDSGGLAAGPLAGRFAKNILYYYGAVARTIFSSSEAKDAARGPVLSVLTFIFFVPAFVGFVSEAWRKRSVREFYMFFYFGLLSVWPVYGSGDARRYVVPVLPFIYWYFLAGVRLLSSIGRAGARAPGRGLAGAVLAAFVVLAALNLFEIRDVLTPRAAGRFLRVAGTMPARLAAVSAEPAPDALGAGYFAKSVPCYGNYLSAAERLKAMTGPADVIMTRKPELVSLITGGFAVRFPYTADGAAMLGFMDDMKVSYILLDGCYREAGEYVAPVILGNEGRFTVLSNERDGTAIVRFKRN
ncbi:MAG: hypothetical protein ACE5GY_00125 [Thermodesulfobacteriota bacterium]